MCGIHGIISSKTGFNKPLCDFVRQAFVANSLRGMDSSGMFQIGPTKSSVYLYKDAVNGSDFVAQSKAEALIRDTDTSLFTVCHVRAKTQGAVNADNAHPFVGWADDGKRIIGVHNGSLYNWKTKDGGKDHEVDSSWAIQKIAEEGQAIFSELQGAFAIVYWDEESPRKINFVRNNQRPMHFLFSKDGKHMMFASEAGMLVWLADRVKFESDGKVRELPVDTVVTFDTSGDKLTWETTKVKTHSYSSTTTYNYNNTNNAATYSPPGMVGMLDRWKDFLAGNANASGSRELVPLNQSYRPSCEVGECEPPFPDEFSEWEIDPAFKIDSDFKFPENVIPPRQHLKVDDKEIVAAKLLEMYGSLITVTWDGYITRTKMLTGSTRCPDTGLEYDVVLRDISKNNADRVIGSDQEACVTGLEADGTIIVHRLTKRMRQMMAA